MGGATSSMQGTIAYDAYSAVPIFGVGIRWEHSPRHSFFLDIELSKRKSDAYLKTVLPPPGLMFEPSTQSQKYFPITLGHQLTIGNADRRFSIFWLTGATICICRLDRGTVDYHLPPIIAGSGETSNSSPSDILTTWRYGLVGGLGSSLRLTSRLNISATGSYRYLLRHGPYTSATGRIDVQQNLNGTVFGGTTVKSRPNPRQTIGGFEAKLMLEVRL
jgi:hypothetical protein